MCGIAGIAGSGDGPGATLHVREMLQGLARRGPDGVGVHAWDAAVLGHRRLAVFDLSTAGSQPMLSPDGRIGVTFNGAVYNFKELRTQLEGAGYRFVSRTDTEVLVHGYDAWGIDGLVNRLHGMFAFGLWDDRTRTLYLVRDRLGVKPLLYARSGTALAFASTAAALNAAGFSGPIDSQAVADFLEFGFVPDERAIYSAVEKLPAAHIARWHAGSLHVYEYWKPNSPADCAQPFEDVVQETERLFLKAVEQRLVADVPVGALLSGGIDSSLLCWAIRHLGADVTAFTVGTPGDEWDESSDAAATARELGVRHHILPVDAENAPGMHDLTAAYGEPFACASALGMLAISRAVREHATVLLTGDGGDDVFLGYPRDLHYFAAQRLARSLPPGSQAVWRALRPLVPKRGMMRRAVHFVDYATGGMGSIAAVHDGFPFYAQHAMLGERLRGASIGYRSIPPTLQAARRVLDDFLEFEQKTRFVSEYMTKVDGATMYYALEARAPFLDQGLWEFASALPYGVRLHRGTLKAILREIARRRIGPRVANGAKRGFGIPVQRWLCNRWRGDFNEMFADSILDREGWIDASAVRRSLHSLGPADTAPEQLWYLYVLEHWMRRNARPGANALSSLATAAS